MSQPLILSFQSDTTLARNAMAQLASTIVSNMVTIGQSMKAANDNVATMQGGLQALPGIARNAALGFVAFEAAKLAIEATSAAVEAARKRLQELVDVGTAARTAGVGSDFFQSWTSHAKELNVEADKLINMLNRAREFSTVRLGTQGEATPTSAAHDFLQQHVEAGNIAGGDLQTFDANGSQEARLRTILDLMDRLSQEGKRLAALDIGAHFFGPDFEAQMRNGADMTGKMRADLDHMRPPEWPADMIQKAEAINKQLEQAQRTMEDGWRPVQQDILRWQLDELQSAADLKTKFAEIVSVLGTWYTKLKEIGEETSKWVNSAGWIKSYNDWIEQHGLMLSDVHKITPEERQALIDKQNGDSSKTLPELTVHPGDTSHSRGHPAPASARSDSDPLETYIANLEKQRAAIQAEADAEGKSNVEKQTAIALAKAKAIADENDIQLTTEQTDRIKAAAAAMVEYQKKIDDAKKAQQDMNAALNFGGQQLLTIIDDIGTRGKKATDIFKDVLRLIDKAVEQAAILGQGPLAGLLGLSGSNGGAGGLIGLLGRGTGLLTSSGGSSTASSGGLFSGVSSWFSGLFAGGGDIPAGAFGIAGEAGPEIIHGPATVLPIDRLNAAANSSVNSTVIHFNVTAPDPASFARSETQLSNMLMRAVARGQRNA
jgi:hypothetical protein